MKLLNRWVKMQYELYTGTLEKIDDRHPGQPVHPNRDYIAGQAAAFVKIREILDMIELLGKE